MPEANDAEIKPLSSPAAEKAAKEEDMTHSEVMDATAWFLSDEVEELPTDTFEMNISGNVNKKKWVRFTIESVDRDLIKKIQADAVDTRTGETDEQKANEFLVVQALTNPDFTDERVRRGYADPTDALRAKLGHKHLLIDAISRRVMAISGGSADDIREVNAAKN